MKKQELINDIVKGLLVAATFATAMPDLALAQTDLNGAVSSSGTSVFNPAMKALTYVCYGVGAVLAAAGIAGMKKHTDNPSNNPIGPQLGKLGAGGALLVAPGVIGVIGSSGNEVFGSSGATVLSSFSPF